ncbi:MAG: CHAT domain-containing protein [Gemmataceae bacterium]|nr:CHAT domain-containing protein [Gemmataceae bacterium]MCI0738432.1 CHAT domain-containing protein [Gemmataceae bacterium]
MSETSLLFTLEGTRAEYTVTLSVDGAVVGQGTSHYDDASVLAADIGAIEKNRCKSDILQGVGSLLFDLLQVGTIADYFLPEFRTWAEKQGAIHIRLRFKARELEALPWESLYYSGLGWLCLKRNPKSSVCRDPLDAFSGRKEPLRVASPLRMLVVIPEGSFLQFDREWQSIERCVLAIPDRVQLLEPLKGRVTPDRLAQRLEEPCDILHYIGHGKMDGERMPSIRFNGEGGVDDEMWVEAETFADLFAEHRPSLVFLNCCLAGATAAKGSLSGLGPYLLRAGVPAVLAMRYEIPDAQAIRFSTEFYQELVSGQRPGRVDEAVNFARRSLQRNQTPDTVRGFITPVLYLATGCEQLFHWDGPEAPIAAQVAPSPPRALTPSPPWRRELCEALQKRRCLPVIGPGIYTEFATRDASARSQPNLLALAKEVCKRIANRQPYGSLEEDLRLCEMAGEWLDFDFFQWVCQHYKKATGRMYELWEELSAFLCACRLEAPAPLVRFLERWPNTPGIVSTHFDGLIQETLSRLRQEMVVVDRIDETNLDLEKDDRVLVHLRGSIERHNSLVLTKDAHDLLWDRINNISRTLKHHLITGTPGRGFLLCGVHPRDSLVRHLVQKLVHDDEESRGPSFFVVRRKTSAEEGYWEPFKVTWIEDDLRNVLDILGE